MVVGIDVFHAKGHRSGSVSGIVSTVNDNMSRFYSNVAIQKEGQEIIDALKVGGSTFWRVEIAAVTSSG